MKTCEDFDEILSEVSFGAWEIRVYDSSHPLKAPRTRLNSRPYLQVRATSPCNVTGKPMEWGGRKWFLSPYMTKSEVVQTAFKAVLTAVEHETREQFTYRGQPIFDPHYDVDKLVELRAQHDCLDEREEAA